MKWIRFFRDRTRSINRSWTIALALILSMAVYSSIVYLRRETLRQRIEISREVARAGGEVDFNNDPIGFLGPRPPITPQQQFLRYFLDTEPRYTRVILRRAHVDGHLMSRIAQLPSVNSLLLQGSTLDDASIRRLGKLTSLEELELSSTSLTRADLHQLLNKRGLVHLFLDHLDISDAELKRIGQMHRLRSLSFNGDQVTDAGILQLSNLRVLRFFRTGGKEITSRSLSIFESMPALAHLTIEASDVKDLTSLKRLRQLKALTLNDSRVGDSELLALQDLHSIESLHLQNTQVGDEGLKSLQNLVNLKYLDLSGTRVTTAGLRTLKFIGHPRTNPLEKQPASSSSPSLCPLKYLRLNNTKVDDELFGSLDPTPSLESISIERTDVSDKGLMMLASMKSLRYLFVDGTLITEGGIAAFKKIAPKVTVRIRER